MSDLYLNDWKDSKLEGLISDFSIQPSALEGAEILLADYTYEYYSGDALVLYRKDGKLFEVNGSHCSCYGLDGQWQPEETTVEALTLRARNGRLGRGRETEVQQVLKKLTAA